MRDATSSLGIQHIAEHLKNISLPSFYGGKYSALLSFGFLSDMLDMPNDNLTSAKKARNDEFYTQYHDIEKEMNAYLEHNKDVFKGAVVLLPCDDPEWSNFTKYFAQNFKRLGLKKLISTSYAPGLKTDAASYQPPLFELESPQYDKDKAIAKGKIFVLDADTTGDGEINIEDIKWEYLEGDGDFRSEEVKKLRDEATHIITNPPFSLFREFLAWTMEGKKKFSIIGNMNAITYKEVFPLIRDNKLWLGATGNGTDMVFSVPEGTDIAEGDKQKAERLGYVGNYTRLGNSCWFANMEHGKRHQPLSLMSTADNIKFSKHKNIQGTGYQEYDNYDAIEVPFVDAIPSDYKGIMGVPITFLDKYNPDQFELLGMAASSYNEKMMGIPLTGGKEGKPFVDGVGKYARIFIKHKTKKGTK